MIYERPDQAAHKSGSNLTWVRGREVDAEVKMRENYLLFRNACWFKSLCLQKFQGKSKVTKSKESVREKVFSEQQKEWDKLKESGNTKKQLPKDMS